MFEEYVGKSVKVVYQDANSNKAIRGLVTDTSDLFLDLKQDNGDLASIRISDIVTIKEEGGNDAD